MDTSSPARLYCTLVGAVLVIAGIIGFFYSSELRHRGRGRRPPTRMRCSGSSPSTAGTTSCTSRSGAGAGRRLGAVRGAHYCLAVGLVYILLALWGFIDRGRQPSSASCPSTTRTTVLHLILGLTGCRRGRRHAGRAAPGRTGGPVRRPGPNVSQQLLGGVAKAAWSATRAHADHEAGRPPRRHRPPPRPPDGPSCGGRAAPDSSPSESSSAQLDSSAAACSAIEVRVVSIRLGEAFGRLDRAQRVGEQALEVELATAQPSLTHRPSAPRAA